MTTPPEFVPQSSEAVPSQPALFISTERTSEVMEKELEQRFSRLMREKRQYTQKNSSAPKELAVSEHGFSLAVTKERIFDLNFPNYDLRDIVVPRMQLDVDPYNPSFNGNYVHVHGDCDFSQCTFPEAKWDHLSGTLLMTVITQAGKAAQNLVSNRKGGMLRDGNFKIKKPAPLTDIHFAFAIKIFVKQGTVILKSNWSFFHKETQIATTDVVSLGVHRDYSHLEALRKSQNLIGERLVAASKLTKWQRDRVLEEQERLSGQGQRKAFGELAVHSGFCSEQHIQACLEDA